MRCRGALSHADDRRADGDDRRRRDGRYISALASAGYRPQIDRFAGPVRALEITPEWIGGFARIGYANVPVGRADAAQSARHQPDFIAGFERIGYRRLPSTSWSSSRRSTSRPSSSAPRSAKAVRCRAARRLRGGLFRAVRAAHRARHRPARAGLPARPRRHPEQGQVDVRGFAGTAGNVVINGARPSSKAERSRHPRANPGAARVRVEVGPGDLFGSDYAGKSQVLNIILSAEAASTATSPAPCGGSTPATSTPTFPARR
jgi:hypothetical protein